MPKSSSCRTYRSFSVSASARKFQFCQSILRSSFVQSVEPLVHLESFYFAGSFQQIPESVFVSLVFNILFGNRFAVHLYIIIYLGDSLAQISPMMQAIVGKVLRSNNRCQELQCSLESITVCSPSLGNVRCAKVLVKSPPRGQQACRSPVYLVLVALGQASAK